MHEGAAGVSIEAQLQIGYNRLRCHLLNLAELIFQDALARSPGHPQALRLLGVTRAKLGNPDPVALLREAAERAPQVEVIWNDLAVALRDAGLAAEAAEAHARAVALRDPKAAPLAPLSVLTFASERAQHAFGAFEYPYTATQRYGAGRPPHPELSALFDRGRAGYAALLREMGEIQAEFAALPMGGTGQERAPYWLSTWFGGLDGMALTQMLRRENPARFLEIGSGQSTKFARRAVELYGLRTRIVSIDPEPRAEVDALCDQVIRRPLEQVDPGLLAGLDPGDILFLDSSHRCFQGSDVTVFFLEILPRLKPGVVIHIHDVYLPDDYISGHVSRMWNEQYLLATALLFGDAFEVLFPAWYVGRDPDLRALGRELLCQGPLAGLDLYGASFWMRKR